MTRATGTIDSHRAGSRRRPRTGGEGAWPDGEVEIVAEEQEGLALWGDEPEDEELEPWSAWRKGLAALGEIAVGVLTVIALAAGMLAALVLLKWVFT